MIAPAPVAPAGAPLGPGAEALPAALKPLASKPRWVVYRYADRGKGVKPAKKPYNPVTGEPADTTSPATWGTLSEAQAAQKRGHWITRNDGRRYRQRYDGIGFVLGDGVAGVDFDRCVDGMGQLAPVVAADVAALNSYTELSPSGTGVKVLVLGELPDSWKADYCEGYDRDRFFALTFRQLEGTPNELRPAPAALDALYRRWAPRGRSETPRAAGEPRISPHALGSDAFWAEVRYWERHRARLLRPDGLPYAMSPQLRDLVERGELPAALAAKGTSPSERRACVVMQLRRRGYAYGDAEAYVVARALWSRLKLETKRERDLIADALRLLLVEYPIATDQRHPASLARARDYARDRGVGRVEDGEAPLEARATPRVRRAPADPAAYLAALEEAATSGVVLLTRPERAALAGIHEKTAQRLEAALEAEGLIARTKPVRTATGRAVYVQILNRINPPILAPEPAPAADVQTPPADGVTAHKCTVEEPQAIGQDTGCPVLPLSAESPPVAAAPRRPTPQPCPVLPAPAVPLMPRELVAEALDAVDAAHGPKKFGAVVAYVRANGGERLAEVAIRRLYDDERARRRYARQDTRLAEKAQRKGGAWRRAELKRLARRMAEDPRQAPALGYQYRVVSTVHEAALFAGFSQEELLLNELAEVRELERGPMPREAPAVPAPPSPAPAPSLATAQSYGPGYALGMAERLAARRAQEVRYAAAAD